MAQVDSWMSLSDYTKREPTAVSIVKFVWQTFQLANRHSSNSMKETNLSLCTGLTTKILASKMSWKTSKMTARYVYMPQVDSGHSTNPAGFEAGGSKPMPKLERKSEIPTEKYLSALKTGQSIDMEKPSTSGLVGLISNPLEVLLMLSALPTLWPPKIGRM